MERRVCISGSRTFGDYALVKRVVTRLTESGKLINVGDARHGVDQLVHQAISELGITGARVYLADWDRWGRSAGLRRNAEMLNDSDELVAIFAPGQASRGTAHAVRTAREMGIEVSIYANNAWLRSVDAGPMIDAFASDDIAGRRSPGSAS